MAASGAQGHPGAHGQANILSLPDGKVMYEYIRVVANLSAIDRPRDPPPRGGNKILDIIEFEMIGKIDLNE